MKQNDNQTRKKIFPFFLETFAQAKNSEEKILSLSQEYDQVSLVIKEEGDMDNPELLEISPQVKVYAGVAWTKIHEMRREEGFYKES